MERHRASHPRLVLDGAEDVVDGDFKGCEFLFSVGLCLVSRGLFVDDVGSSILALPLTALFRGAVGCVPSRIFNLNVFLDPKEDVPRLDNFVFYQVLVGLDDLQPTNERCRRNVFVAVIYMSHLALEITDIVLEALPGLSS